MALAFVPTDKFRDHHPRDIADELWSIAAKYHFHPSKDTVENSNNRISFSSKIERFIEENLDYTGASTPLAVSLECIYTSKSTLTHPRIDRSRELTHEMIRNLTIGWASFLVKIGFRGFTRDREVINRLRKEAVWLLERFGYQMPNHHALFCPLLTVWEDAGLDWQTLHNADCGEKITPTRPKLVLFGEACKRCLPNS